MTAIALADHPYAQALAWALVHFLWQGALVALAAMAVFRLARRSANARYVAGIAALAVMLVAPSVTTAVIASRPVERPAIGATASAVTTLAIVRAYAAPSSSTSTGPSFTATILVAWAIGVIALSIRLLGGWLTARGMARKAHQPAGPHIQAMLAQLTSRLGMRRIVAIAESSSVAVPIMIGWLKPIVILPTAVASGFTTDHIEALIVHELAHIRRHDYLVNLLQSVVETVLFYHPAVWWVSSRVRAEREHCCDDVAVTVCDRLTYAQALSSLAELATPQMAMAASNGSLVDRVRRILGRQPEATSPSLGWLPVFMLLALAAPVLSAPMTPRSPTVVAQSPVPPAVPSTPTHSTPAALAPQAPDAPTVGTPPPMQPPQVVVPDQRVSIDAYLAKLKELAERQRALEAQRQDLTLKETDSRAQTRTLSLMSDLENLRAEFARIKRRVDIGLDSPDSLAAITQQMAATEREVSNVKQQLDFDKKRVELDTMAADQKREYEQALREYNELLLALRGVNGDRGEITEPVTDASAQIREGDVMLVTIPGESGLPPAYRVSADGTIKLPLLPALSVGGLTAEQAANAIAQQLKDRQLGANRQITVSLRRPR